MATDEVKPPPKALTKEGKTRRVGVEIEFAGLSPAAAAAVLADWLGGTVSASSNPFVFSVRGHRWGDFDVELDTRFISADEKLEQAVRDSGIPIDEKGLEVSREVALRIRDAIGALSAFVVPTEIVTPPIPWNELGDLSGLMERLRETGAEGTDENVLYGFGLHLNPELYSERADDLLAVLRAYVILSGWLRAGVQVDMTRRILPHVDPFPDDYAEVILDPGYAPSLERLVEDYVLMNPTRNRELDMLPAFAHLAPDTLHALIHDERIKARPTFHYRLPNVLFSDPDWSVGKEWNRWVAVETLAADPEGLDRLGRQFLEALAMGPVEKFLHEVSSWVKTHIAP
jgi:hypothetical protein